MPEAKPLPGHKPIHTHDSTCCTYMGTRMSVDVYVCLQAVQPTVIGRYGCDGPEYGSGTEFCVNTVYLERRELSDWNINCASVLAEWAVRHLAEQAGVELPFIGVDYGLGPVSTEESCECEVP